MERVALWLIDISPGKETDVREVLWRWIGKDFLDEILCKMAGSSPKPYKLFGRIYEGEAEERKATIEQAGATVEITKVGHEPGEGEEEKEGG